MAITKIDVVILFIVLIILLVGCRGVPPTEQQIELFTAENELFTAETDVKNVVNSFLDAEQNSNYARMNKFLIGEAREEAAINFKRGHVQKDYLSVKLEGRIITPELAAVYADITALFESYSDRYALNFYLIKQGKRWSIYSVEPAAIERPAVAMGEIPAGAQKVLEEYFSLPFELKKYQERDYLAGQLLDVASQLSSLQPPPAKTSKGFEVQEIKSLGDAEGYCIAEVTYFGGNNDTTITNIVDIVDVGGQWKIARMGIAGQERGN